MSSYQFTSAQFTDILNRLRPHLPANLTSVKPNTYGFTCTFTPFTGQEPKPESPAQYWEDPQLAYEHIDKREGRPVATEAEYELRDLARYVLDEAYSEARVQWKNARHVAQLKKVVKDASARWKAYQQAKSAVEAAFAYLRDPQAATEWPSAISRLVDAHNTYMAAAIAFDERAQEIAEVHSENFHEEMLGYDEALAAAGYPEAKDWLIASPGDYSTDYRGEYGRYTTAGQAQRLIKDQEAHVTKVGQLTGQPTT